METEYLVLKAEGKGRKLQRLPQTHGQPSPRWVDHRTVKIPDLPGSKSPTFPLPVSSTRCFSNWGRHEARPHPLHTGTCLSPACAHATCQALPRDNPATQAGSRSDRKESKAKRSPLVTFRKLPLTRPRVSTIVHGAGSHESPDPARYLPGLPRPGPPEGQSHDSRNNGSNRPAPAAAMA